MYLIVIILLQQIVLFITISDSGDITVADSNNFTVADSDNITVTINSADSDDITVADYITVAGCDNYYCSRQ